MLTRIHRDDDAGMTLTELLVGMSLLLTIATLTLTFFISQSNQAARTLDASFATSAGRTALTTIATELRLADTPTAEPGYPTGRFLTASATQVVFFSNVSADRSTTATRTPPTKIDIHVTGSKLIEQDYKPITAYTSYPTNYDTTYASNYPSTPTSTTVLTSQLSNTTSVFSYCATPTSSAACPAIDTGSLGTISLVSVTLVVFDQTGAHPQTYQTSVSITGATS